MRPCAVGKFYIRSEQSELVFNIRIEEGRIIYFTLQVDGNFLDTLTKVFLF
jgi:hypothetical protein